MAKTSGLKNIKFFDRKIVTKLSAYHLRVFKHRVQVEGKDADGTRFRPYTMKYRKLKAKGFKKKDGTNYKNVPRVKSTKVTPPDFTLTGRTMQSLKVKNINTDGYKLEWTDPDSGAIIKGNKKRGRDIVGVPGNELKKVRKILERYWSVYAKRKLSKTINIRVG